MESTSPPPIAPPLGLSSSLFHRRKNSLNVPSSQGPHPPRPPRESHPSVRRKPLPPDAAPVIRPHPQGLSTPFESPGVRELETVRETSPLIPRDHLHRDLRGQSFFFPSPPQTARGPGFADDAPSDPHYLPHGTPVHTRLASEPIIPVVPATPPLSHKRSETMALHPPSNRPPPLNIEPPSMPAGSAETKQPPKTPGNKITSLFGWKTASSPGAESTSTEISDTGRSPLPSPLAQPFAGSPYKVGDQSLHGFPVPPAGASRGSMHGNGTGSRDLSSTVADLEKELREVSAELAGSIRREMELEDLVERLQQEVKGERRSSDYFSDYSGSSSIIRSASDGAKSEDIDKVKRMAEQERAQLKVELSQRWQEERSKRMACESHVQILENQVQQYRRERDEVSNLASKTKELETALEDTRRKLAEERQLKDNFEDLLTGMRVELEQLRNERDHLRDEVIPSLSHSKGRISAIAEEEGGFTGSPRNSMIGLSRSNSLARRPMKPGGSLSRSNSVSNRDRNESKESLAERVKDVEAQRDALHQTLRYLLSRHAMEARETQKRITILEMELERAQQPGPPRKHGYEREVRNLREEINHLRRRADDAMEQKWQCEKGLAGLKMDLDRAEQETESLRQLLQEHDEGSMQAASASLEAAYNQLQADLEAAAENSPPESLSRAEQVAGQVRQRLDQNRALRERLAETITKGDREQKMSAMRINDMQSKLKTLEEALMTAQQHSEEAMAKHEEEVRALKDSHNANLTRARMGIKSPLSLSPRPESSPFAGGRSPRLDQTTSGEAVPLSQAIQIEQLELRVKQLEKGLREAEFEMEEVVGLMNKAQGEVAQLQSDRDDALLQMRQMEAEILAARKDLRAVVGVPSSSRSDDMSTSP